MLAGSECELELYWLDAYGGGMFVPFADATSGDETYGAGRYLLDTVKGADLGTEDGRLVLDFNLAYNPSCSYDPRWACPLSPPANRLPNSGPRRASVTSSAADGNTSRLGAVLLDMFNAPGAMLAARLLAARVPTSQFDPPPAYRKGPSATADAAEDRSISPRRSASGEDRAADAAPRPRRRPQRAPKPRPQA